MKVLTAAEMREVDRKTIEAGIPGPILMENAGHRVVEFLAERCKPLERQRIAVFCGKGNNGGDGLVIARQLHTRIRPAALWVLLAADPDELRGDAAANCHMLAACGCPVARNIAPEMRTATLLVDALLGTGVEGAPRGIYADWIQEINRGFPLATVVAVDIPSGLSSDSAASPGPFVKAAHTVTFTAPKLGQVLDPNCEAVGALHVVPIGTSAALIEDDPALQIALSGPAEFGKLFAPRPPAAHKGDFGHVLVVGGSRGKSGAAALAGLAALRSGAGLVTVATAGSVLSSVAAHTPELMTAPLPETATGAIRSLDPALLSGKTVLAIGPGIGTETETAALVEKLAREFAGPVVADADALNCLAGKPLPARGDLVLTPHPGEMARLTGMSSSDVQSDRLAAARTFARDRGVIVVLKGRRTIVAFPDGTAWINPTGGPALATGGSGDILTGLIAGLIAQFPRRLREALLAAVWLHGRAGDLGAAELTEQTVIAGDLLRFLPGAIRDCASLADPV
jgi:ADP-dependent NAD(P)H-hydrate dehydratase / NAD(P)H-hydrate epimerase